MTPTVNKVQLNVTINELFNGSYLGNCYDAHIRLLAIQYRVMSQQNVFQLHLFLFVRKRI